jgi:hypothetical protein
MLFVLVCVCSIFVVLPQSSSVIAPPYPTEVVTQLSTQVQGGVVTAQN